MSAGDAGKISRKRPAMQLRLRLFLIFLGVTVGLLAAVPVVK